MKIILKYETLHKIYVWLVPLPYLAIIFGWMVTEFGRQPWIIYKIMLVSEGISDGFLARETKFLWPFTY